jgi:hypothetical protein
MVGMELSIRVDADVHVHAHVSTPPQAIAEVQLTEARPLPPSRLAAQAVKCRKKMTRPAVQTTCRKSFPISKSLSWVLRSCSSCGSGDRGDHPDTHHPYPRRTCTERDWTPAIVGDEGPGAKEIRSFTEARKNLSSSRLHVKAALVCNAYVAAVRSTRRQSSSAFGVAVYIRAVRVHAPCGSVVAHRQKPTSSARFMPVNSVARRTHLAALV